MLRLFRAEAVSTSVNPEPLTLNHEHSPLHRKYFLPHHCIAHAIVIIISLVLLLILLFLFSELITKPFRFYCITLKISVFIQITKASVHKRQPYIIACWTSNHIHLRILTGIRTKKKTDSIAAVRQSLIHVAFVVGQVPISHCRFITFSAPGSFPSPHAQRLRVSERRVKLVSTLPSGSRLDRRSSWG